MIRAGRLRGKVAVVTGAASGIGEAVAGCFVNEGAKVLILDVDDAGGYRVAESLGDDAVFRHCDVSEPSDLEAAFEECESRFGKMNVLVNNAAIQSVHGFEQTDEAEWQRLMDVNVKAVFFGIQKAIPFLRRAGGGAVINTSSEFAIVGSPGYSAYHATKGAVSSLTRAGAIALLKDNIRVNAVCAGTTMTPGLVNSTRQTAMDYETAMASFLAMQPMNRFAEPIEMAYAFVYLASDEATFVNGAELVVDGGYTVV